MYTLGINAAFHDPAASLVRDGSVVAAAEENVYPRQTWQTADSFQLYKLPFHAIDFCLRKELSART